MILKHQIIAVEKIDKNSSKASTWNNDKIIWFIVHQQPKSPKSYEICLQMVYVSSQRTVKVNGQLKHTAKVTFGYECDFEIGPGLQGKIKQDGLRFSYQLYVNGVSFTDMEKSKLQYEALNQLSLPSEIKFGRSRQNQKQDKSNIKIEKNQKPVQKIISKNTQIKLTKQTTIQPPVKQQDKIKDTQKQLMKILKAQKLGKNDKK